MGLNSQEVHQTTNTSLKENTARGTRSDLSEFTQQMSPGPRPLSGTSSTSTVSVCCTYPSNTSAEQWVYLLAQPRHNEDRGGASVGATWVKRSWIGRRHGCRELRSIKERKQIPSPLTTCMCIQCWVGIDLTLPLYILTHYLILGTGFSTKFCISYGATWRYPYMPHVVSLSFF